MKRNMIFLMVALSLGLHTTRSIATPVEKPFWETKKAYYGGAGLFGVGAAYGAYKLLFNKKRSAALGKLFSREGGGVFRGLMARMQDPEVKASSRWLAGTLLMAVLSAKLAVKGSSLKGSSQPNAPSHTAVTAQQHEAAKAAAAMHEKIRLAMVEREQIIKEHQQDLEQNLQKELAARADILKVEEEAAPKLLEQIVKNLKEQERKEKEAHKAHLEMKQKIHDAAKLQRELTELQAQSSRSLSSATPPELKAALDERGVSMPLSLPAPVAAVSSSSDVVPAQKARQTQWTIEDFQEKLNAFEASYKPKTQDPLDDAEYVNRILDHRSIQDLDFDPNFFAEGHAEASVHSVVRGASRYGNIADIKRAAAEALLSLEHSRLQALRQLKGSGKAMRMRQGGAVLLNDEQIDKRIDNVEIVIRELCDKLGKDLPSDVKPEQEASQGPLFKAPRNAGRGTVVAQESASSRLPVVVSKPAAKRPWGQGASLDELQQALDGVKEHFFATRPADGTLTKGYIEYLIRQDGAAMSLRFRGGPTLGGVCLLDVARGTKGFAGYKNSDAQNRAMLTGYSIAARRRRDLEKARVVADFSEYSKEIDKQLADREDLDQLEKNLQKRGLSLPSID